MKKLSKNINKSFEELRAEMIAYDYKIGESWKNKFFKKKRYKNFQRAMFFHYLDLIEEIREKNKK